MAKIVVIDSEETVRSVVDRILRRAGHSVHATGDFNEALTMLKEAEPDLVITNVFLRGITGHEAMLHLKVEFPRLPVLMMSGLPDEAVIHQWLGETNFDIFPKPFMPDSLIDKVDSILRKSGEATQT